jgi:hypothetical protein
MHDQSDNRSKLTAMMFDANPVELMAAYADAKLTTPDKEDWQILLVGNEIQLDAFKQVTEGIQVRSGRIPLGTFKRCIEQLRSDHNLGYIMLIVCKDTDLKQAAELTVWLTKWAKSKNFSFVSFHGPASTAEALRAEQHSLSLLQQQERPQ